MLLHSAITGGDLAVRSTSQHEVGAVREGRSWKKQLCEQRNWARACKDPAVPELGPPVSELPAQSSDHQVGSLSASLDNRTGPEGVGA